jgi:hypothetical protein
MQITELHPPINNGSMFFGRALSRRGRHYQFCATPEGEACGIFREDPRYVTHDGKTFWEQIKAPLALQEAVRKAVAS